MPLKISKISKILPLFGLAIFIYLVINTGPAKIASAFTAAEILYFIPAVILLLFYMSVQTLKWNYLLKKQKIKLRPLSVFKIYMIGAFYGSITPGRIGTLIRVKYVKKKTGKNTGEASISVVVDKILDLFAVFFLSFVGIVVLANYVSPAVAVPLVVSLILVMSIAVALLKKSLSQSMLRILWRLLVPSNMKENAKETFHSFHESMLSFRTSLKPFILSFFGWILVYTSAYTVALSIGINLPYFYFIMIMSISTVISLIPVTVGGLGTREAALVMFLSLFGVSPEQAIVMSIINNLLNYAVVIPLGLACSLSEEKTS